MNPHLRHFAHDLPSRRSSLKSKIKIRTENWGTVTETVVTRAWCFLLSSRVCTCHRARGELSLSKHAEHQKQASTGWLSKWDAIDSSRSRRLALEHLLTHNVVDSSPTIWNTSSFFMRKKKALWVLTQVMVYRPETPRVFMRKYVQNSKMWHRGHSLCLVPLLQELFLPLLCLLDTQP